MFLPSSLAIDFHWSLIDSESLLVFRTLLSTLADLNNAIVLGGPDLSSHIQFFQSFFKAFKDRSKCTNQNWYSSYSHVPQLFCSILRSYYLSHFSFSLSFILWSARVVLFFFSFFFFFRMVKFKLLSKFPVDHFHHPVMFSVLLYFHLFTTFALNMIGRFVFVTTSPTLAILLLLVYFCFNVVCPYGVLCYY